jgi:hypothetical protein
MRGLPRRFVPALLAAALLVAAVPSHLLAQRGGTAEPDPLLGTWQLNLAKSKYSPGPPLRSETRTYVRDEMGVKGRIDRRYADGRHEVIDYRADFDKEVPVSGTQAYDAIVLKRLDARTTEGVLSHAGRVFGTSRRTISEDGKTMTISFRREEPGDMVNNLALYDKVMTIAPAR